jgi:hypothetical protein
MKIQIVAGAVLALWIAIPTETIHAQDQEERQVTLVGCVMREHVYRDMYGPGLSGPRGAGIGGRNEYMLVDAREVTAGAPPTAPPGAAAAANACPPAPGTFPTAYELTGSREGELDAFLGRRVEITGIQKEASVRPVGTSGVPRPTGGFDPLGHELHLFEVEIASFGEPGPALAAAPPAAPPERAEAPAPAPEPEPAPAPEIAAVPEPQPAPGPPAVEPPAPQIAQTLPRTASPLPLAGLFGLLSLIAAASLRAFRR